MSTPTPPEAVCWDLDGTLVDSERYWIESETALITAAGGSWSEREQRACVGAALDVMARHVIAAGVDASVPEVIRAVSAGVSRRYREQGVPWRPGVLALLTTLRDAGVPQAIVTMSHRDTAGHIAEQAPDDVFTTVVSGDQVPFGKPHPAPYETAVARLGVTASRTIAFEDSPTGIASATAAGLLTIGVPCVLDLPAADDHLVWPTLEGVTVADLQGLFRPRPPQAAPQGSGSARSSAGARLHDQATPADDGTASPTTPHTRETDA